MRFSRTFLARASMGGIDLVYLLWRQLRTTNELFATAKEEDPACNGPGKSLPDDVTNTDTPSFNNPVHILGLADDIIQGGLQDGALHPPAR